MGNVDFDTAPRAHAEHGAPGGAAPSHAGASVQMKQALAGSGYDQQASMLQPRGAGPSSAGGAVAIGGVQRSEAKAADAAPVQRSPGRHIQRLSAPVQLADDGTPGNNQAQNRQFEGALREIERKIGRRISRDERRRLHDAISGQDYGYKEIVDEGVAMFGGDHE